MQIASVPHCLRAWRHTEAPLLPVGDFVRELVVLTEHEYPMIWVTNKDHTTKQNAISVLDLRCWAAMILCLSLLKEARNQVAHRARGLVNVSVFFWRKSGVNLAL